VGDIRSSDPDTGAAYDKTLTMTFEPLWNKDISVVACLRNYFPQSSFTGYSFINALIYKYQGRQNEK
jgi:hypothetical protein